MTLIVKKKALLYLSSPDLEPLLDPGTTTADFLLGLASSGHTL